MKKIPFSPLVAAGLLQTAALFGTNPLVMDQFTADPTARVFGDKIYVYPSHDIVATEGKGRPGWFCMEDYHVFSSGDLNEWKDHGVILRQTEVPWANPTAYSMWAPDCVQYNGRYYFFFPAIAKEGGFRIGVAIADKPEGPFVPQEKPIEGIRGIDPAVLVDKDGSAYLYYPFKKIFVAKLKPDLLSIDGAPIEQANLPEKGLVEGPFVFERNGIYYLTYPHVENKTERLEYAMSDKPQGPFKPAGVIVDELASGCWTIHQSIVEYKGQWYLFYHDSDLSPDFDKNRSMRADRLFFNDDGTIRKIVPTLRGVGLVKASDSIQIDRYSATSGSEVVSSFLNPARHGDGWKVTLAAEKSWVRFNEVDFSEGKFSRIKARAQAAKGAAFEVRLDAENGPVLARLEIGAGSEMKIFEQKAHDVRPGVHDLFVVNAGDGPVDVDWIVFQ